MKPQYPLQSDKVQFNERSPSSFSS